MKSATTDLNDEQISIRINLTIAKPLLELIDKAAEKDFTTRSDIIRVSLLWYLRPQGPELDTLRHF